MSTPTFEESTRYGSVLFVYIFVMAVIGTAGMALGWLLGGPELATWTTDGWSAVSVPPLIGGLIIWVIGLGILVAGTFAVWYKLISDAVKNGVGSVADAETERAQMRPERPQRDRADAGSSGQHTQGQSKSEDTSPVFGDDVQSEESSQ